MSKKAEFALAEAVGKKIRETRKQKKITLIELSATTEVAQATLSRMENGQMLGTVESHRKIAEALGISLSYLYAGIDERVTDVDKLPSQEPKKVLNKTDSARIELMVPNASGKKIIPTLVTIHGNAKTSMDKADRGVEKFVVVLEGHVKVAFQSSEYELREGDSLYFDASAPHQIVNLGSRQAKVLAVSSK